MAFLLIEYIRLLGTLEQNGYSVGPVKSYFEWATPPFVFLRHDVDRLPSRAMKMAQAERAMNISTTYYFRCHKNGNFPSESIKKIAALGHEVGFHYETLSQAKGNLSTALKFFEYQLEGLRKITEVKTVVAHGSPFSKHFNWCHSEKSELKRFGLLGEPMLDMDFSKVFYITDTGGIFGSSNNLRDWSHGRNLRTATTPSELGKMLFPQKDPLVLLNTHPERWPNGRFGLMQALSQDMIGILLKKLIRGLRG